VLPALFAAAHGAGLACVGQIYRPGYAAFLPPPARWVFWPAAGALACAALALSQQGGRTGGPALALAAGVGLAAPLLHQALGRPARAGAEIHGARNLAASLAGAVALALGLQWACLF